MGGRDTLATIQYAEVDQFLSMVRCTNIGPSAWANKAAKTISLSNDKKKGQTTHKLDEKYERKIDKKEERERERRRDREQFKDQKAGQTKWRENVVATKVFQSHFCQRGRDIELGRFERTLHIVGY